MEAFPAQKGGLKSAGPCQNRFPGATPRRSENVDSGKESPGNKPHGGGRRPGSPLGGKSAESAPGIGTGGNHRPVAPTELRTPKNTRARPTPLGVERARDPFQYIRETTVSRLLERFQAKWIPVRVKKTRQTKTRAPFPFHRNGKGSRPATDFPRLPCPASCRS
jgi:hypothetical protein